MRRLFYSAVASAVLVYVFDRIEKSTGWDSFNTELALSGVFIIGMLYMCFAKDKKKTESEDEDNA